jgi:GT2 family glycosyltransferase
MTKIAILMPTYNGGKHIEQAITSVIASHPQKYGIHALYISDDHSQDETVTLIRNMWDHQIPLIVLTTDHNQGLFANHNFGLSRLIADGVEWALIVHQDDYVKPHWLEVMVEQINKATATTATICSSYDAFHDDDSIVKGDEQLDVEPSLIKSSPESIRDTLLRGGWWHLSGSAIRLSTLVAIGNFDASLPHMGDWDWTARCLSAGHNILYIPRTLVGWRQHIASYSSSSIGSIRYTRQQLTVIQRYRRWLTRRDIVQWFSRELWFALQRVGAAVVKRNIPYLTSNLRAIGLLSVSGIQQFWMKPT